MENKLKSKMLLIVSHGKGTTANINSFYLFSQTHFLAKFITKVIIDIIFRDAMDLCFELTRRTSSILQFYDIQITVVNSCFHNPINWQFLTQADT